MCGGTCVCRGEVHVCGGTCVEVCMCMFVGRVGIVLLTHK